MRMCLRDGRMGGGAPLARAWVVALVLLGCASEPDRGDERGRDGSADAGAEAGTDAAAGHLQQLAWSTVLDPPLRGHGAVGEPLAGQRYAFAAGTGARDLSDVAVVMLDGRGRTLWTQTLGDPAAHERVVGLAASSDGDLLLAVARGPGAWVIRLAADGRVRWDRTYEVGSMPGTVAAVDAAAAGGFVLVGRQGHAEGPFVLRADSSGAPLWLRSLDELPGTHTATSVAVTDTGSVLVCGGRLSHDPGNPRAEFAWVVALTQDGETAWTQRIDEAGTAGRDLTPIEGGDVLLVGSRWMEDGPHSWAARLTGEGVVVWIHSYDLAQWGYGSVAPALSGGVFATASSRAEGGFQTAVARLDDLGEILWEKSWEAGATAGGQCVRATAEGGALVVGQAPNGGLRVLRLDPDGADCTHGVVWGPGCDGNEIWLVDNCGEPLKWEEDCAARHMLCGDGQCTEWVRCECTCRHRDECTQEVSRHCSIRWAGCSASCLALCREEGQDMQCGGLALVEGACTGAVSSDGG